MSTYDVVELGKFHLDIKSDRAFALAVGLTPQNIADWKAHKAMPNKQNVAILAKAARITKTEAMNYIIDEEEAVPVMTADEMIEFIRKNPKDIGFFRIRGFADVSLLLVTSMAGIALLALKSMSLDCILC